MTWIRKFNHWVLLLCSTASFLSCIQTLVACCTTHCVKGFLSFNPISFTHVPPDVTASKLCEYSILEILFGIVFTKLMVYFSEEISNFQLCCGGFFPMGIQAYFLRILNCSANESETLALSEQSLEGR